MINATSNARLIKGFSPSSEEQEITYLQFADDTILFCDAEEEQLRNFKAILLCFEAVLGLRVNFFKSELIGIRVDESRL